MYERFEKLESKKKISEEDIKKIHETGKLTAEERIQELFDNSTFENTDLIQPEL